MRFHKTVSRLAILFSIFGCIKYTAAAEENNVQAEKNVVPERFTRQTESKFKRSVAANPTAVASDDLDPLRRDKRQLGSWAVSLACSSVCGTLGDGLSAPCVKICKSLGSSVLPLLASGGLSSVLKNVLGSSALSGRSAGGVCPCPFIYRPVCGHNGKTYSNACVAKCDGVSVVRNGPCPRSGPALLRRNFLPRSCNCLSVYKPVCGRNGKTYPNSCAARCERVLIERDGECEESSEESSEARDVIAIAKFPCLCSKIYKPVCGSDGVTYDNLCLATCAEVMTVHPGPCAPTGRALIEVGRVPCFCLKNYEPVCASNGETYDNLCVAVCAEVFPVHKGPCE